MTPEDLKALERGVSKEVDWLLSWLDVLAPKPWDRTTLKKLPEYLAQIRSITNEPS